MLRKFQFSSKKQQFLSKLRNNCLLHSLLYAPRILIRNEISKEACVLSYYGLFSCIPILVFFLRLSQHLFSNLDWKEWLLIKFPDYKNPILAIVEVAYHSTTSNIGVVIVGSFFVFCWSGILMLLSLEDGLNKIYRTGWTAISVQRLVTYFMITLISPMIFIIVAGSWVYITQIMPIQYARVFSISWLMTALYSFSVLLPYVLIYLILFFCYAFLPRVSVQKTAALIAALIAGSLWVISQKIFFCLQFYLFNYSFTYGALVALPSFLLLLYLYACIYLFGGAFAFLFQNQGFSGSLSSEDSLPNGYIRLVMSVYILAVILKNFNQKDSSMTLMALSKMSKIPVGELAQCLATLEKEEMILLYKKTYKPAYNISDLTIKDIIEKLLHLPKFSRACPNIVLRSIQKRFACMFDQVEESSHNLTLKDIAEQL